MSRVGLLKTLRLHESKEYTTERFEKGEEEIRASWKKFMVGGGPSKHWVYKYE